MSGRVRHWLPASLLLFAPAAGFADHCLKPCPAASSCPSPALAPAPKIVVEMSPPEITFKPAPPVTVQAPAKAAAQAGHCAKCGAPTKHSAPAPAPAYAPPPYLQYALVPVPAYGPPPAYGYGPPPCGAAPQAGPPCNNGAGYGMPSSEDLKAFADLIDAHERTALQQHMAYLERQYAATATKAAAAGLRPAPLSAPAAEPKKAAGTMIPPAAPAAGTPMTTEQILQEIDNLKAELQRFKLVVAQHDLILEEKGLSTPAKKR